MNNERNTQFYLSDILEYYLIESGLFEYARVNSTYAEYDKFYQNATDTQGILESNLYNAMRDYLFAACCGESRHAGSMAELYIERFKGLYRSSAQYRDNPYSLCDENAKALESVFDCNWHTGAYGGESWGKIAHALLIKNQAFFIDHITDLSHNGGVLFNKEFRVIEDISEYSFRLFCTEKTKWGFTGLIKWLMDDNAVHGGEWVDGNWLSQYDKYGFTSCLSGKTVRIIQGILNKINAGIDFQAFYYVANNIRGSGESKPFFSEYIPYTWGNDLIKVKLNGKYNHYERRERRERRNYMVCLLCENRIPSDYSEYFTFESGVVAICNACVYDLPICDRCNVIILLRRNVVKCNCSHNKYCKKCADRMVVTCEKCKKTVSTHYANIVEYCHTGNKYLVCNKCIKANDIQLCENCGKTLITFDNPVILNEIEINICRHCLIALDVFICKYCHKFYTFKYANTLDFKRHYAACKIENRHRIMRSMK